MSFVRLSKICLTISAALVLASILLLVVWQPRLSIEFTGGTLMELRIPEGKTKEDLQAALSAYDPAGETIGTPSVSAIRNVSGESMLVRMKPITNDQHTALLASLTGKLGEVTELQFTTIGPSVSASLKQKALIALAVASLGVIVYLAFAFRKLPKKLNPWKFGTLAVLAFAHDIIITAGIFVIISHTTSFEFDTLFVTALLTILAYSANDTIVIFDRIRANLTNENRHEELSTTIARSLKQCMTRTLHTTTAGLIMLFALFFLGSESIRWFILALIVGTFIGTYSSYLIAAPLLMFWRKSKN